MFCTKSQTHRFCFISLHFKLHLRVTITFLFRRLLRADTDNLPEAETTDGRGGQVRGADVPGGRPRPSSRHPAPVEGP